MKEEKYEKFESFYDGLYDMLCDEEVIVGADEVKDLVDEYIVDVIREENEEFVRVKNVLTVIVKMLRELIWKKFLLDLKKFGFVMTVHINGLLNTEIQSL